MANKRMRPILRCSFCGMPQGEVGRLFGDPDIGGPFICEDCSALSRSFFDSKTFAQESISRKNAVLKTPLQIKEHLDQYVVGQESAKKVLSVAVYNHYKRIFKGAEKDVQDEFGGVELQKSNVLLLGPTGSGKTYLAQTLAKIMDVPFAITDATTLTEAGYVGEDVENILLKLIEAADYDISRAQKGIIYIDEIDKIAKKGESVSITRDVSGEGVQQSLLKILEGTVASVPPQGGRKHPTQEMIHIDTSDILFIVGGAFAGIEKLVNERRGRKSLGFNAEVSSSKGEKDFSRLDIQPQDLVRFGLIPEFIGRVPIITMLEDMNEGMLMRVLKEPRNALVKQYKKLFRYDGVELEFEEGALEEIARLAAERKTGARGLRSIMEKALRDVMYEVPSDDSIEQCLVTRDVVTGQEKPVLKRNRKKVG